MLFVTSPISYLQPKSSPITAPWPLSSRHRLNSWASRTDC